MATFLYDSPEFKQYREESAHHNGELTFLESIARPGMTAVGVGANTGATCVALAKAVGEHGRVYAFEPRVEPFDALKDNMSANDVGAIVDCHRLVLGDHVGEVPFYVDGEGSGVVEKDGIEPITTGTTTMDAFVAEHGIESVAVINMDCEGSELLVLEGGEQTLRASHPQIFCEVHHQFGVVVGDLVSFLEDLGYHVEPLFADDMSKEVSFAECTHVYAKYPDSVE
jgi:FkbM family methyltransferase